MPRLAPSSPSGPRVTTRGQVISGPGSPASRSARGGGSSPRRHPPPPLPGRGTGRHLRPHGERRFDERQQIQGLAPTAGGFGLLRKASISPTSRSWPGSRFMPQATRLYRAEQVYQHRHVEGLAACSHHVLEQHRPARPRPGAGSEFRSSPGSGNRLETRTSRPSRSRRSMKSRKLAYDMSLCLAGRYVPVQEAGAGPPIGGPPNMLCRPAKTDTFYAAARESCFNIISLGGLRNMAARTGRTGASPS